ncbi:MAG: glutamyl-tRNA reductase [Flavobacteriaceae bacterium]
MNNKLRYISISHKSASLAKRERYHISGCEKKEWLDLIRHSFNDIRGLLVLITCNRTEIYFESDITNSRELRDFIIHLKQDHNVDSVKNLFVCSNNSEDTMAHLLEVSTGLASTVLGDAEIIHQIKTAYNQSRKYNLQGSLLERCMQSVFKSHKRISNETRFRDGTTSVAYKSLKVITNTFDKSIHDSLKILFIGAGDIVKQLFNYNNKFGFNSVHIANRTVENAKTLIQSFGGEIYDWEKVVSNDISSFDVVVSAVSNRPNLLKSLGGRSGKTLLIDLAVPGNIDKNLVSDRNIDYYDLDTISAVLKETQSKRLTEIGKVESIIRDERMEYKTWLENASTRKLLADYKHEVNQWVTAYVEHECETTPMEVKQLATNRIVRRSLKHDGKKISEREMRMIVEEHL